MGNSSSRELWAVRERQGFIERVAWWRGAINRGDLKEMFGISLAQASADFQAYIRFNPGALAYNLNTKRYEAQPGMECLLQKPRLEDGMRNFLGTSVPVPSTLPQSESRDERVAVLSTPQRVASADVERRIFLAITRSQKVKVKYWSVNSGGGRLREIAPHALGHDGHRWHARAWCFLNQEFRDFVLSRIEKAEWPEEEFTLDQPDVRWRNLVEVVVRPHTSLDPDRKRTIERDYAMKGGKLVIPVREAMRGYLLAQLGIDVGKTVPNLLELAE